MCGQISLQGQLITIRDKYIQTCLQIFVNLMHYFTKFAKFLINNCNSDIKLKLGLPFASLIFSRKSQISSEKSILHGRLAFTICTN